MNPTPTTQLANAFSAGFGNEFLSTRYSRKEIPAGAGTLVPFFVDSASSSSVYETNMEDNGKMPNGNSLTVRRIYVRAYNTNAAEGATTEWAHDLIAQVFAQSNLKITINNKIVGSFSLMEFLPVVPMSADAGALALATNGQLFKDLLNLPLELGSQQPFQIRLDIDPNAIVPADTSIEIGLWGKEVQSLG